MITSINGIVNTILRFLKYLQQKGIGEIMMNKRFEEKKKEQLNNLAHQVIYGEHKSYFYCSDIEAG